VVGYIYVFSWIKHENEYTSGLASQLSTESQKQDEERRLAQAIKETDADRTKLNSYFVSGDGSVQFLGIIEGYGTVSGAQVKFTSVEYTATKNELIMNLHITGTFQNVYQTILMLENAPYEFDFHRIIFSRDNSQSGDITKKTVVVSVWNADINFGLKSVTPAK
jgi:hypothetical protein